MPGWRHATTKTEINSIKSWHTGSVQGTDELGIGSIDRFKRPFEEEPGAWDLSRRATSSIIKKETLGNCREIKGSLCVIK